MAEETMSESEKAQMRRFMVVQKVALGIILKWKWLFILALLALGGLFTMFLVHRASISVKRYDAVTRLIYSPRRVAKIEPISDKQLMSILERRSLKRRIAEFVKMPRAEAECLVQDVAIVQERRPTNIYTLTTASQTMKNAVLKANTYAEILIEEYVAYRTKDLENWRTSVADRHKALMEQLSEIEAEEAKLNAQTGVVTPQEKLMSLNTLISDQRRNLSAFGVDTANEEAKRKKLEAIVGKSGDMVKANAASIRRRSAAIAAIDRDLVTLRERYTDINPKVVGKLQDRETLVKELQDFLKSKGVSGLDIDNIENIDAVEKAASELAECVTRLEAIAEKRRALEQEIKDNEKRATELTAMIPEYERLRTRHADVEKSVRDLSEQLDDIAYLQSSLQNDLRQIERAGGAGDKGPLGARQILQALVGTAICFGGLFFWVLMLEFCFGKVRDGREIMAYDDIKFVGSIPKEGAFRPDDAKEMMGVVALKLLGTEASRGTVLVCRLPGAVKSSTFEEAVDFNATMSGLRVFTLSIVASATFTPPEDGEQMIGVVKKGSAGWFPVVNRYAIAPTEMQMLQVDLAEIHNSFDTVFVRIEGGMRRGGSFFDQLLGICEAIVLVVGTGKTPRTWFTYAHRHAQEAGKPVLALATGASARAVRIEMEAKG